jgi:hypothetical protein
VRQVLLAIEKLKEMDDENSREQAPEE